MSRYVGAKAPTPQRWGRRRQRWEGSLVVVPSIGEWISVATIPVRLRSGQALRYGRDDNGREVGRYVGAKHAGLPDRNCRDSHKSGESPALHEEGSEPVLQGLKPIMFALERGG